MRVSNKKTDTFPNPSPSVRATQQFDSVELRRAGIAHDRHEIAEIGLGHAPLELDARGLQNLSDQIDARRGVYDIHSPRVPSVEAMQRLLERACEVIPAERLWVNPDCGLKTRGWPETEAALGNLVQAAKTLRTKLAASAVQ